MSTVASLRTQGISAREACDALGVSSATYYRRQQPQSARVARPRPSPPRALPAAEREHVLEVLHSERFVDSSPAQVSATLLDDDQKYLCSPRTMYRILDEAQEVKERRNQCRRPIYRRPELVATGPNQVWTWDLTKLRGPAKWTYYYLYVVLDLFSRLVVAWMLAHRESGELAKDLFSQAYDQQGIEPGQLTVHNDRGSAPTAKTLYQLHADLGVDRSVSRPYVSNDNPYSEAQFKTFKYAPGYPDRFGSYPDGLIWCRAFFPWYNGEHRHSALTSLTPAAVHEGRGEAILAQRHETMLTAYAAHPERFPNGLPRRPTLPEAVWINPPEDRSQVELHLADARKGDLPGVETFGGENAAGSRIAEGDERSDLVLDAVAFSPHSGLLSPPSTVEDLH
jgi:putative transposase